MKKVFAIVAVAATLLVAGKANAQMGINVGYAPQTYTTVYTNGNNSSTSTLEMNGFFAGLNYSVPVSGDLCLSLGAQVRYNTKSEESNTNVAGGLVSGSVKNDYTQMLVDVPILLNYSIDLGSLKLTPFIGAVMSYGMSGNVHTTASGSVAGVGGTTDSDTPFYGENGNWKNMEVGGTLGACITFTDFRLFGGYNMGLVNFDKRDNYSTKGSNIYVGIGYNL